MLTIVGTASLLISDGIASCSIESRLVFSISIPLTELIIKLFYRLVSALIEIAAKNVK